LACVIGCEVITRPVREVVEFITAESEPNGVNLAILPIFKAPKAVRRIPIIAIAISDNNHNFVRVSIVMEFV